MHPEVIKFHKRHLKKGGKILAKDLLNEYLTLKAPIKTSIRNIIFNQTNIYKLLKKIRMEASPRDLAISENILLSSLAEDQMFICPAFPQLPNTEPTYIRFEALPLETQLYKINVLIKENFEKIQAFSASINELNNIILNDKLIESDNIIMCMFKNFGYSHFLLNPSST